MRKVEILNILDNMKHSRSAWERGVREYAYMILYEIDDDTEINLKVALNGARNWKDYSWRGFALCYDGQIAQTLCTPSELKKVQYKDGGYRKPNKNENWLDVQARALYQAWKLIEKIMEENRARID